MGKCLDDFKELVDDLNMQLDNGKIDVKAMEATYIAVCAGHLAEIVDRLDVIASKLEEKENKDA